MRVRRTKEETAKKEGEGSFTHIERGRMVQSYRQRKQVYGRSREVHAKPCEDSLLLSTTEDLGGI